MASCQVLSEKKNTHLEHIPSVIMLSYKYLFLNKQKQKNGN